MSKPPKDALSEAKRIAAKMLAMPPQPHGDSKPKKAKPGAKKKRPKKVRTDAG